MSAFSAPNLQQAILDYAQKLGFDPVGIAPAIPPPRSERFQEWLNHGYAGTMTYLNRSVARRQDPRLVLEGAKSVICVGLSYAPAELENKACFEPSNGVISVYAAGQDYHDILGTRLVMLEEFIKNFDPTVRCRSDVDSGPILERDFAEIAGLGFSGKNTLLISKSRGSFLFLGEILTTLELPPTLAPSQPSCGSCTCCLTACPTQAFAAPYILDARRCISYLTIEYKGIIPCELRPLMGNKIFGCDDCQTCCPWNIRFAEPTREEAWKHNSRSQTISLPELATFTEFDFQSYFAGTPVLRARYEPFMRNVAIALGNCENFESLKNLSLLLSHPSPLVRLHAVWGVGNKSIPIKINILQKMLATESDPLVREEIVWAMNISDKK